MGAEFLTVWPFFFRDTFQNHLFFLHSGISRSPLFLYRYLSCHLFPSQTHLLVTFFLQRHTSKSPFLIRHMSKSHFPSTDTPLVATVQGWINQIVHLLFKIETKSVLASKCHSPTRCHTMSCWRVTHVYMHITWVTIYEEPWHIICLFQVSATGKFYCILVWNLLTIKYLTPVEETNTKEKVIWRRN